jgi:predicted dinucleotide-binding enzyme
MRIGIIGPGRIGSNAARWYAQAGHDVMLSFSRDPAALQALAQEIGSKAQVGTPRDAAEFGEVVMLSVPWTVIDEALEQTGPLSGKIVIDTTNHFGPGGVQDLPAGMSAAEVNAGRMPGARLVKSYNTLTSTFQAEAAGRTGPQRIAMFYAGEDAAAKRIVAELIADSGFEPVDLGGWAQVRIMEAPRRPGAVYGEAYHPDAAHRIAEAVRRDPREAADLAQQLRIPE